MKKMAGQGKREIHRGLNEWANSSSGVCKKQRLGGWGMGEERQTKLKRAKVRMICLTALILRSAKACQGAV